MSSVANVFSIKFDFITMGKWLILWNCLMLLGQILILRRDFKLIQLLQLPLSFIFGYFVDFAMWLVSPLIVTNYFMRIILIFIGVVILALGVSLSVIANVILNSGEAFVKAISDTLKQEFGVVKSFVDCLCVLTALILSLIFFDFNIVGIREGTIIVALLTGLFVRFFIKRIKTPVLNMLKI